MGVEQVLQLSNQWRLYEQEEVPSISNGRMIRSVMNAKVMLDLVSSQRESLDEKTYAKLISKIEEVIAQADARKIECFETQCVYNYKRGVDNGFAACSLERLKNLMLLVLNTCGETWLTKMNKLLFYIDFAAYRNLGSSVSGLAYKAIEFGPVPVRWERVYSVFDEVRQEPKMVGDFEGNVLVASREADTSVFTADELAVIHSVLQLCKDLTSSQLSEISHEEQGWIDNVKTHQLIGFNYAFQLNVF